MVEKERAGIWAGRVRVALSRPHLSPHPLPFQCRERGVAAFAGEMADDKGAGEGAEEPAFRKSGRCEKYFKVKG